MGRSGWLEETAVHQVLCKYASIMRGGPYATEDLGLMRL